MRSMVRCWYQGFSVEAGVSSDMILEVMLLNVETRWCRSRGVVGDVGLCAKPPTCIHHGFYFAVSYDHDIFQSCLSHYHGTHSSDVP
jgi:hypothetical protein